MFSGSDRPDDVFETLVWDFDIDNFEMCWAMQSVRCSIAPRNMIAHEKGVRNPWLEPPTDTQSWTNFCSFFLALPHLSSAATLWAGQRARFTESIQKPLGGRTSTLLHLKCKFKSQTTKKFLLLLLQFLMLKDIYSVLLFSCLKIFNLTCGWVWEVITSYGKERNSSMFLSKKYVLAVTGQCILYS